MNKRDAQRSEHEENRKIIADITCAIEALVSRSKKPQELEGTLADARPLAMEWAIKGPSGHRRPLFDDTANPTSLLLGALAVAQRREIAKLTEGHKVLEQIRRHCHDELEDLVRKSDLQEARATVENAYAVVKMLPPPKRKPCQYYERKRSRRFSHGRPGLIEQQFGRVPHPLSDFSPLFSQPAPTCLDGIIRGEQVSMSYLQELFGLDRHRFPKKLPRTKNPSNKREKVYGHRAVVMIGDALLSEEPRTGRGRKRKVWLSNPDDPGLRTRVLNAIKERVTGVLSGTNQVCVPDGRAA